MEEPDDEEEDLDFSPSKQDRDEDFDDEALQNLFANLLQNNVPRAFYRFIESLQRSNSLILREFLSFKWFHLNGTRSRFSL